MAQATRSDTFGGVWLEEGSRVRDVRHLLSCETLHGGRVVRDAGFFPRFFHPPTCSRARPSPPGPFPDARFYAERLQILDLDVLLIVRLSVPLRARLHAMSLVYKRWRQAALSTGTELSITPSALWTLAHRSLTTRQFGTLKILDRSDCCRRSQSSLPSTSDATIRNFLRHLTKSEHLGRRCT